MKMRNYILMLVSAIALLSACGSMGGTEAGNPTDVPTAKVVGMLVTPCAADTIAAVDSLAASRTSVVNAGCAFELTLPVDAAYRINLVQSGKAFAAVTFKNGPARLPSPVMFVSRGADRIDLGLVTIAGDVATPGEEPSMQTDRDGDGVNDYDDADDDNDSIEDVHEEDCDFDGFLNDDDEERSTCSADQPPVGDGTAGVFEVRPLNNEGIAEDTEPVELTEVVEARASCVLDRSSVTSATFTVQSSLGAIDCTFVYSSDDEQVTCRHDTMNFVAGVIYTATIDGVQCVDGTPLNTIAWSWKTGFEN